ncbi:MAG: Uma2 family endonuclease [Chloroflexi bacterium]|nr:Uma2 family endonuclease [Chloroflexota bacterium]
MPVSEKTYRQLVLEDPDSKWELYCGRLRSKPEMTWGHNQASRNLRLLLERQLSADEYLVIIDQGRVRRSATNYFIPDLYVVPQAMALRLFPDAHALEAYPEALPLVVEVWSPSTGDYDVEEKFVEYKARGDLEIWRIHPYEKTVTVWRRQVDGSYDENLYTDGDIHLSGLSGVTIAVEALFRYL